MDKFLNLAGPHPGSPLAALNLELRYFLFISDLEIQITSSYALLFSNNLIMKYAFHQFFELITLILGTLLKVKNYKNYIYYEMHSAP